LGEEEREEGDSVEEGDEEGETGEGKEIKSKK
jgi:hypothetical protein